MSVKIVIKSLFFIIMGLLIVGFVIIWNFSYWTDSIIPEWAEYKKNLQTEYPYINEITTSSTRRSLIFSIRLSKEVEFEEIEVLFNELKSEIFSEEKFDNFKEFHKKNHDDDFHHIYVRFFNPENSKVEMYEFLLININDEPTYDSFRTKYLYDGNTEIEYNK